MSSRARSRASRLLLLCVLAAAPAAAPAAEGLRAGFAHAALPAPEDGPLGGYGGLRDRRADGIDDPPQARALVLEQGELRVGLVALDLVIVRADLRDALLAPAEALGIDALVVVATHTHSGPGGYIDGFLAERVTAGGFAAATREAILAAARAALEGAVRDLSAARAASGVTSLELAANRRHAGGPAETALPVLRLDAEGRAPILLFAYGMHPTVRSRASRHYSADYVGPARERLEAHGWRPLFVPGPLGDQGPTSALGPIGSGDPALEARQTDEVGGRLAEAVAREGGTLEPRPDAVLAVLERWADAPPFRLRRFCALWWLGPFVGGSARGLLPERAPLHALRVGEALLVALPAEPATALGDAIRARAPDGSVPFVVSHANDWLGYALGADEYRAGGYEACLSFHGPGLGAWLVENAGDTIAELEARRLE